MIKADKGTVIVSGELTDVKFECHHLIRAMIEEDPEIISAVIFKNADGLQDAIKKSNKDMLKIIEDYIEHIEHVRKECSDEE